MFILIICIIVLYRSLNYENTFWKHCIKNIIFYVLQINDKLNILATRTLKNA